MPPHAEVVEEIPSAIQPDVIDHSPPVPTLLSPSSSTSACTTTATSKDKPSTSTASHSNNNIASTQEQWTPQGVLSTIPAASKPKPGSSSPVQFMHILSRLKTTKREGWRRFGISQGESISDHMYRMSIITMLAPPSLQARLDMARCTKMALVHDMAELLVGDITPVDGVSKSEKSRREASTMQYLCDELLGNVDAGVHAKEIKELWYEYEESKTPESVFVHDVDKMELLLQMLDYERQGKGVLDLGEFAWVARRIVGDEVKQWCQEVLNEREAFWRDSVGKIPTGADTLTQLEQRQRMDYYNGSAGTNGTH